MHQIVWLKRDIRLHDHRPLLEATRKGPTVAVYIVEPEWLSSPYFSARHLQFLSESLMELETRLATKNIPLWVFEGGVLDIFSSLKNNLGFENLYSHEETGVGWTFKRDIDVANWCREHSVRWHEYKQFAVVRPLKSRDHWNYLRKKIIERPLHQQIASQKQLSIEPPLEARSVQSFLGDNSLNWIHGGTSRGQYLLESFFSNSLAFYQKGMSSPLSAFDDCSQISAHLTWGTLSMSEVWQRCQEYRYNLDRGLVDSLTARRRGLKAFESRLWWHCHFMQKLEDQPNIEFQNINPGFSGMRPEQPDNEKLKAWCQGNTGFPLLDACMRALNKTGWLNFRMRAMLISFSSYQLWQPWQKPSEHLARMFTDFEPGIHFSQIQMQSGVTGINAIRVYSPVKQSYDQDPEGEFIKKHCPELEGLDAKSIHEPWQAPPLLLQAAGVKLGENYPLPIVDPKQSYNEAKAKIYKWKGSKAVRVAAKNVYRKHGSRKNQFFPHQRRSE